MIESTNSELIRYLKNRGSLRNVDVWNSNFDYEASVLVTSNHHLLVDPVFENCVDDKLYVLNTARSQFKEAQRLIISVLEVTAPKE